MSFDMRDFFDTVTREKVIVASEKLDDSEVLRKK